MSVEGNETEGIEGVDVDDVEPQAQEMDTVTLEVPVSEVHQGMIDSLEQAEVDVEEELGRAIAPSVEETIHKMYQQGRYGQQ